MRWKNALKLKHNNITTVQTFNNDVQRNSRRICWFYLLDYIFTKLI